MGLGDLIHTEKKESTELTAPASRWLTPRPSKMVWTDIYGVKHNVEDMDNEHILHCILLLDRKLRDLEAAGQRHGRQVVARKWREQIQCFYDEMEYRGHGRIRHL